MYHQTTLATSNSSFSSRNCPAPKMNSTANLLKLFVSHDRRVDVAPRATFVIALQIACNLTSVTTSLPRPAATPSPRFLEGYLIEYCTHTHVRACQAKQMRKEKKVPRRTHTFGAHCLRIRLQYMLAILLKFYITLIYNQAWHINNTSELIRDCAHTYLRHCLHCAYLIYIFVWDKYYLKMHTINLNWVAR